MGAATHAFSVANLGGSDWCSGEWRGSANPSGKSESIWCHGGQFRFAPAKRSAAASQEFDYSGTDG